MGGRHRQVAGDVTRRVARAGRAARAVPPGALAMAVPLALLAGAGPAASALTSHDTHPVTVPSTPFSQPASDTDPSQALGLTTFPTGLPSGTVAPPMSPSSAGAPGAGPAGSGSAPGVPGRAFAAYRTAAALLDAAAPGCHLTWPVLAGIGTVESGNGTAEGAQLGADGVARPTILGPRLDGTGGTAAVRDTDGGRWDGDPVFDRAVGPMQFIPGTWQVVGVDADRDGVANPSDIDDAAASAGRYLCAGGRDLATPDGLRAALLSYNHSQAYADLVERFIAAYASGRAPAPMAFPGAAAAGSAAAPTSRSSAPTTSSSSGPSKSSERSASTRPAPSSSPSPSAARPTASPTPSHPAAPAPVPAANPVQGVVGAVTGVVGGVTGGGTSAVTGPAPTPSASGGPLAPVGDAVKKTTCTVTGTVTSTVGGLLGATPTSTPTAC